MGRDLISKKKHGNNNKIQDTGWVELGGGWGMREIRQALKYITMVTFIKPDDGITCLL